jgi:undecaprenyl-diphosphatase
MHPAAEPLNLTQAAVLGVVQGLTEFLPISSTAHLRVVPYFLGWHDPGAEFSAVIQLGTLIAVLIYFWRDVLKLIAGGIRGLVKRDLQVDTEARMAWGIALGTIPVVLLGLTFKDFIKNEARELWVISAALIGLAVLLWWAEQRSKEDKTAEDLGFMPILWIGLCQALALIPGSSRSGSTIMGGLLVGLNRAEAARFSFLLGLPAILGSGLFELYELMQLGLGGVGASPLAVGIGMAFISGYASIEFLLRFLRRYGTLAFVAYRIALGAWIGGLAWPG